jgi:hypothetical protein
MTSSPSPTAVLRHAILLLRDFFAVHLARRYRPDSSATVPQHLHDSARGQSRSLGKWDVAHDSGKPATLSRFVGPRSPIRTHDS